jgi:hypothetical protein
MRVHTSARPAAASRGPIGTCGVRARVCACVRACVRILALTCVYSRRVRQLQEVIEDLSGVRDDMEHIKTATHELSFVKK